MFKAIPPAIILAGGLGTRLSSVLQGLPKTMADINGKPFLHYLFQYLSTQHIQEVILAVGYRFEPIQAHFGEEYLGIKIQYSIEQEPLGTGGGIRQAFDKVADTAFVLNGDTFFKVDFGELQRFYETEPCDLAISLKPLHNFDRYGTVRMEANSPQMLGFDEKRFCEYGLINGGVYLMNKQLFSTMETIAEEPMPSKFSFETDVLEQYVSKLKFTGKAFEGYFIDIGIPVDYEKAKVDFVSLFS